MEVTFPQNMPSEPPAGPPRHRLRMGGVWAHLGCPPAIPAPTVSPARRSPVYYVDPEKGLLGRLSPEKASRRERQLS